MLQYTPAERCRFGVFPRHNPELIRWYNLERSCLIFHTANTWTDEDPQKASIFTAVNLLACRMSGDSLIWAAGNIQPPGIKDEEDECLLYYCKLNFHTNSLFHSNVTHRPPFTHFRQKSTDPCFPPALYPLRIPHSSSISLHACS